MSEAGFTTASNGRREAVPELPKMKENTSPADASFKSSLARDATTLRMIFRNSFPCELAFGKELGCTTNWKANHLSQP